MAEILTEPPRNKTLCPTCGTEIYTYNLHTCTECLAQVCFYCEGEHFNNHRKERDADHN